MEQTNLPKEEDKQVGEKHPILKPFPEEVLIHLRVDTFWIRISLENWYNHSVDWKDDRTRIKRRGGGFGWDLSLQQE